MCTSGLRDARLLRKADSDMLPELANKLMDSRDMLAIRETAALSPRQAPMALLQPPMPLWFGVMTNTRASRLEEAPSTQKAGDTARCRIDWHEQMDGWLPTLCEKAVHAPCPIHIGVHIHVLDERLDVPYIYKGSMESYFMALSPNPTMGIATRNCDGCLVTQECVASMLT